MVCLRYVSVNTLHKDGGGGGDNWTAQSVIKQQSFQLYKAYSVYDKL
jgi:hypothetical protein